MPFDRSKDAVLASETIEGNGNTSLVVSAHSYNGGETKIQIGRIVHYQNGNTGHRKLGRMTLEESMAVAGVIPQVLETVQG